MTEPIDSVRPMSGPNPTARHPDRSGEQLRMPLAGERPPRDDDVRRPSEDSVALDRTKDDGPLRRADDDPERSAYSPASVRRHAEQRRVGQSPLDGEFSSEDLRHRRPSTPSLDQVVVEQAKRTWAERRSSPIHGQIRMNLQSVPHPDPLDSSLISASDRRPSPFSPHALDHPRANRPVPGRDPYHPPQP